MNDSLNTFRAYASNVLFGSAIILMVLGVMMAIMGACEFYNSNKICIEAHKANGRLYSYRVNSKALSFTPSNEDIATEEYQVSELQIRAAHMSSIGSISFGMSGICLGVGSILISIVGGRFTRERVSRVQQGTPA